MGGKECKSEAETCMVRVRVWVVVLHVQGRARTPATGGIELSDGFGSGKGSGPGRRRRSHGNVHARGKGLAAYERRSSSSTGEKCFHPSQSLSTFHLLPTRKHVCVCVYAQETIRLLPIT